MKPINILHISDIHADESTQAKLHNRVKAFLDDVENLRGEIDLVIVTGDIALSGKKQQFEIAEKVLFEPLLSRLQISKNRLFIAPGNHDVNRDDISIPEDTGLKQILSQNPDADEYFKDKKGFKRLKNFYDFTNRYLSIKDTSLARIVEINHITVGVGVLNSAWLCADDKDKNKLFLSEFQVSQIVNKLDGASIKIALMHHPPNWFNEQEQKYVMSELKRQFDAIMTGHLHESDTSGEVTPQYNTILLTAPSLYNNYVDNYLGYNLYTMDLDNSKLKAVYKKFMRKRNTFDRDTEYAQNGEHYFELKTKTPIMFESAILCQKISLINSELEASLKKQLAAYQQVPEPILVTPRLASVSWRSGQKSSIPITGDPTAHCAGNTFIYAPKDMGKSVLMKTMAAKINQNYYVEKKGRIAALVDLNFKDHTKPQLFELINSLVKDAGVETNPEELFVFVDHINHKYLNQLAVLHEISSEMPDWKLVIAIENDFWIETIYRNDIYKGWQFFEVCSWGPSRIREFIVKYIEASEVKLDVEAAFNFICHSLKNGRVNSFV